MSRTHLGRGCGPSVRQITDLMNYPHLTGVSAMLLGRARRADLFLGRSTQVKEDGGKTDAMKFKHFSYHHHHHHHACCLAIEPLLKFSTVCGTVLPTVSLPSVLLSCRSFFPSVTCFRRHFLNKMWPIQLALLCFIVRRMLLFSLTLCKTLLLARTFHLVNEE